jgi:tight adherence protein B
MLFLIAGCLLAAFLLVAYAFEQSHRPPQVDLREKLKNLAKDPEAMAKEIELGAEKKSLLSRVDFRSLFTRFTGQSYMDDLEKKLTQSDIPLKPGEFLAARLGGSGVAFVLTGLITRSFYASMLVLGVALVIHIPILKIMRGRRINKFVTQLAEFLVLITNSLRSGQTFLQGVEIASKESPNPIGMEFRLLLKETNLGVPVESAFGNMLLRVPSEDLKIVMSAFSIQRNVGGNLADIMDQVAAMIRQRIQIQGQIKVLTTQGKLSGLIVGLLPFVLGAILSGISYDYMKNLWTPWWENPNPLMRYMGPMLLVGGIILELLGSLVIYKICDIEV